MDEPISALDDTAASMLLETLKTRLKKSTILILSHTPEKGFEQI
jgi:ABC-type multidrug transport system ATPase subunit